MSGVSEVERLAARMLVEWEAPSADEVASVVAGDRWQPQRVPDGVRFDVTFPGAAGLEL
ncbi:hypothetical protein [Nocardia carnea]|uniref:hypothetical protein n=1 Tax=Nocardia carnea TaxID=37328 RepID=UPI000309917D|nr:hypothetical protein [Nocardia carnea]